MDAKTGHALQVLARLVKSLPNRTPARAVAHIAAELQRDATPTSRALGPTTRAEIVSTCAPRRQSYGVPASPGEFAIAARALRCAQRYGLRLHPCRIQWFNGDEQSRGTSGFTIPGDAGGADVWLRRGLSSTALFRTVVHEMSHVHDIVTGRHAALSKVERERRADRFEHRAVRAGWRP